MANINLIGMDSSSGQFRIATINDFVSSPGSIIGMSGIPNIVLGSASGLGSTAGIIGSNLAGKITFTTGASLLSSGIVMTMTFANGLTYPNGCFVNFTSGNSNFASVFNSLYATTTTNTVVLNVTIGLSIITTYIGYYQIIGY